MSDYLRKRSDEPVQVINPLTRKTELREEAMYSIFLNTSFLFFFFFKPSASLAQSIFDLHWFAFLLSL